MSKRTFQQAGFTKTSPRHMARTRKAIKSNFKPRQSSSLKAKIGSIEHKFITSSVNNSAISKSVTCTGIFNDPVTGGICVPITGNDIANREGRRTSVDEIIIRGHVLFPSAEHIADIALCGQMVKIAIIQDQAPKGTIATTSDIYTNATGTIYGNVHALRNPNGISRFTVLKTVTIIRPVSGVACQVLGNDTDARFAQTSTLVPFEIYIKLKNPIKQVFNATDTTAIASIENNSIHVAAWTGGDDNTAGVNTRMDCNLTYNARCRFYG